MSRVPLIALSVLLFIGCNDSASTELPDPRAVAVGESLTAFHAMNSRIRDEVIYVRPGEFVDAVPQTLGGKPVEIIESEELLQRIGSRKTAPRYTTYSIGNNLREFDFYVAVSVTGIGNFSQFETIPLGGGRIYCYTIENGVPKVQDVIIEEH
ncbi:hypothetical protein [Bremerella sp. P1]|uniref:hypothetical protein n=1 Tax=Bremerella sp. P1 TaxID=3026424 RepID=UPI00236890DA|nr:hypothetical protein [Bremerella sp. P1]WDI45026.1 hypothetical protein PSR63_13865 [Bremerella sp. P1]